MPEEDQSDIDISDVESEGRQSNKSKKSRNSGTDEQECSDGVQESDAEEMAIDI